MQRPSLDGLLAAIDTLEEQVSWDLLLLQELSMPGESWPELAEAKLAGHMLVLNSEKMHDTAVLVHRRFVGCAVAAVSDMLEEKVVVGMGCERRGVP